MAVLSRISQKANRLTRYFLDHRYGFSLFIYITAAIFTGVSCVVFMRLFDFVLRHSLTFQTVGRWCWVTTPILFLIAVEMIRKFAPLAAGTGIPQTIFASQHLSPDTEQELMPLVSLKTMTVKIVTLLLGVWACASTGREGPSVHVATCVFMGVVLFFRRWMGFKFDHRSVVVAGGAAGLAAAFNTPLAGLTFAIEELNTDQFASMKEFVLMAIIVAAIAAKSLTGEYAYFGKLLEPEGVPLLATLLIGIAGGVAGAFFSTALIKGTKAFGRFRETRYRWLVPVGLSLALLVLGAWTGENVFGPGNQAAQTLTRGEFGLWVVWFPLTKMAATLFTYWSGMAGGIFAPSLSIGSALGATLGHTLNVSVASCALIGMAAFLSGTIQAPITSFVIIFEMTGHHQMLLPIMLGSLSAFMVARLLGADHLYQTLAEQYHTLLKPKDPSS